MSEMNFLQSTHTSMVLQSSVSSFGNSGSSFDELELCFDNLCGGDGSQLQTVGEIDKEEGGGKTSSPVPLRKKHHLKTNHHHHSVIYHSQR